MILYHISISSFHNEYSKDEKKEDRWEEGHREEAQPTILRVFFAPPENGFARI